MNVAEAKEMVMDLMFAGQPETAALLVDSVPPDGDPGKFRISGKAARVIHRFSGWHVPISLAWFTGGYDQPVINKAPFYWQGPGKVVFMQLGVG